MKDTTTLRVGGWAAIVGAVLALLVNLVRPRPGGDDLGDVSAFIETAEANSSLLELTEIGALVALLILLAAFYAITKSIEDPPASRWARLGLGAIIVGTTLGMAAATVVEGVGQAGESISPAAVEALVFVASSLLNAWMITYVGVGALLYGIALTTANEYPTWLGWVTLLAGLSGLVGGLMNAFLGQTAFSALILLPIGTLLLILVILNLGVLLLRQAANSLPGRA